MAQLWQRSSTQWGGLPRVGARIHEGTLEDRANKQARGPPGSGHQPMWVARESQVGAGGQIEPSGELREWVGAMG